MIKPITIPDEWRMLIECLRCAIHDTPPPADLKTINWTVLLRQARQHSVECYLFPWLSKNIPELFSTSATTVQDSAPAIWRTLALKHLRDTIIRQQQVSDILQRFAAEQIDVIPLKGTWLSEKTYEEPSQRCMVDIDLLVRKKNIEQAHLILSGMGYKAKRDLRTGKYICDDSYYHPLYQTFIELHWNVASEMIAGTPIPDIEKIWDNTKKGIILEQPIREFQLEDQLSHLVQHILHHAFALSLKSYIDIALILKTNGPKISYDRGIQSASYWKTGNAVPFILCLVSELFRLPIPAQFKSYDTDVDQELLQSAVKALFELPEAAQRSQEHNLLKYSQASAFGKIKFIIKRIFMPRSFMIIKYPFARYAVLLPAAWVLRTIELIQRTGKEVVKLNNSDANLSNARDREMIIKKLTGKR